MGGEEKKQRPFVEMLTLWVAKRRNRNHNCDLSDVRERAPASRETGAGVNPIIESLVKNKSLVVDLDVPPSQCGVTIGDRKAFSLKVSGERFDFTADVISIQAISGGSQISLRLTDPENCH